MSSQTWWRASDSTGSAEPTTYKPAASFTASPRLCSRDKCAAFARVEMCSVPAGWSGLTGAVVGIAHLPPRQQILENLARGNKSKISLTDRTHFRQQKKEKLPNSLARLPRQRFHVNPRHAGVGGQRLCRNSSGCAVPFAAPGQQSRENLHHHAFC